MLSASVDARRHTLNTIAMNGIIFMVEDAPVGGYVARALGQSIVTERGRADEAKPLSAVCGIRRKALTLFRPTSSHVLFGPRPWLFLRATYGFPLSRE